MIEIFSHFLNIVKLEENKQKSDKKSFTSNFKGNLR